MAAGHADLILTDARVWTADAEQPHAQAVAVAGNRILAVGSAAEVDTLRGPATETIGCGGRTLLPGFIDSHFHLLYGSLNLDLLQLDEAHTLEEIGAQLGAFARANPELEWVRGVQLKYSALAHETRRFDRHFLDAIVPDRPVYLTAFDGHTSWANTIALQRGGIFNGRELPPGSEIIMDAATGTATGELREPDAMNPVRELAPKTSPARTRALLEKGLALCARNGLTSVHNMDGRAGSIELYAALEAEGAMTLRIYVPYDINPETPVDDVAHAAEWRAHYRGGHVRAGAVKVFMDGVLESYTALMVDDYAGAPGNKGDSLHSAERFNAIAAAADRLGLQVFVHACGDGAVRRTLDGYAHARRANGVRDSRHRVEHVEQITAVDVPRFCELGVIASMQPLHCPPALHAGDVWPSRVGVARWPLSFAWESLRQAGTRIAWGSDWPVVSMSPRLGLWAGRNREPWAPGQPDHDQSMEALLRGYTCDAAYAEFMEHEKGRIRAGFLADLALLDADLFATPDSELGALKVTLTVCDGKIVHREL